MLLRQKEIRKRKDRILGLVVAHYIQTVSPVSSGYIARESSLDLSPATIRNILAELEEEGLLMHPHTSAGRVPTQNGYRYYVDHLLKEIQLLEEEKIRIKAEYEKECDALDILLDKTSKVLSETTHYTSIISVDGFNDKIFLKGTGFVVGYPEAQDINKIRFILSALEEKEKLLALINRDIAEKVNIFIGYETACADIESCCSLVVSSYKTQRGPSGRIAVLGPTRMDYGKVIPTLNYVSALMEELF